MAKCCVPGCKNETKKPGRPSEDDLRTFRSDLLEKQLRRRLKEKQLILEQYRKARDFWFEKHIVLEAKYNELLEEIKRDEACRSARRRK